MSVDYGTKVLNSLDGFSVSITTITGATTSVPLPLPGITKKYEPSEMVMKYLDYQSLV